MAINHGNEQNFDILTSNGLVLVDFFANWCGPCRMLSSQLEDLDNNRSELKIVKVNVDENHELSKKYGIMSIPALLLFKDGKLLDSKLGYMPKELIEKWIEEAS